MRTPAEKHARNLIAEIGREKARQVAQRKVDDAAFMVCSTDNRKFWVQVLENLR